MASSLTVVGPRREAPFWPSSLLLAALLLGRAKGTSHNATKPDVMAVAEPLCPVVVTTRVHSSVVPQT